MFAGFPIVTSYIIMDHFRAVGWFNVAIGAAVLLLLVTMFHGEYKCSQCLKINVHGKIIRQANVNYKDFFCKVFVSTTLLHTFSRVDYCMHINTLCLIVGKGMQSLAFNKHYYWRGKGCIAAAMFFLTGHS